MGQKKAMEGLAAALTECFKAATEAGTKHVDARLEAGTKHVDARLEAGTKHVDARLEAGTKHVDARLDKQDATLRLFWKQMEVARNICLSTTDIGHQISIPQSLVCQPRANIVIWSMVSIGR